MDNPASRALLRVLPAAKRAKEHHTALPYQAVPSALHKVGLSTCYPLTKLAFRLLVMTATRSGEVRGADWSEIDLEDPHLGNPKPPNEGRQGTQNPVVHSVHGHVARCLGHQRPGRPDIPSAPLWRCAVRYDPHAVAEAVGDSRNRSRFPVQLSRLGG